MAEFKEWGRSRCKVPSCGWETSAWHTQKCPRCGSWCRYFVTNLDEHSPEGREALEAFRAGRMPASPGRTLQ